MTKTESNVDKSALAKEAFGENEPRDYIDMDKEGLSVQAKFSNEVNDKDYFKVVDTFTSFESNLFFACIAQVYDKQSNIIRFSSETMKRLVNYKRHIGARKFAEEIQKAFNKFLAIQETIEGIDPENGEKYRETANLFRRGRVYIDTLECYIQVDDNFVKLFNGLQTWTRFSLYQYTHLQSQYSRKLFRLLKQFRTSGKRRFLLDDFTKKVNAPKSYKSWHVYQRIIQPSIEELAPYFQNIHVTKDYEKGKRGRKLRGYIFTWTPEGRNQKDIVNNKALERTRGYYFIKSNHYLTPKTKFRAVDRFYEQPLGTTEKLYKHRHPNTYFLENTNNYSTRNKFIRGDLEEASGYGIERLRDLIVFYEKLNRTGFLQEGDIKDLIGLELLLLKKIQKAQTKGKSDSLDYKKHKDTIVEKEIDDTDLLHQEKDVQAKHIRASVIQEWSSALRGQDNRSKKIDDLFDDLDSGLNQEKN